MTSGALQVEGSTRPEPVMEVAHVDRTARNMAGLPLNANILATTVMATAMPYVVRG
jgi:hypothetical protein